MISHRRYGKCFAHTEFIIIMFRISIIFLLITGILVTIVFLYEHKNMALNIQSSQYNPYNYVQDNYDQDYSKLQDILEQNNQIIKRDQMLNQQIQIFIQNQQNHYKYYQQNNIQNSQKTQYVELKNLKVDIDFTLNNIRNKQIEQIIIKSIQNSKNQLKYQINYDDPNNVGNLQKFQKFIRCKTNQQQIHSSLIYQLEQQQKILLFVIYNSQKINQYYEIQTCYKNAYSNFPQIGQLFINLDEIQTKYNSQKLNILSKFVQISFIDFMIPIGCYLKSEKTIRNSQTFDLTKQVTNSKDYLKSNLFFKSLKEQFKEFIFSDKDIFSLPYFYQETQHRYIIEFLPDQQHEKPKRLIKCSQNNMGITLQDEYVFDCQNYLKDSLCFSFKSKNKQVYQAACLRYQCVKGQNAHSIKIFYDDKQFFCRPNKTFIKDQFLLNCPSNINQYC